LYIYSVLLADRVEGRVLIETWQQDSQGRPSSQPRA
jgi:hypothetical protein